MNVKFDFSGKTVLVTGGSSGIGRATVEAFAHAGANIAVVDINREAGESTAQAICDAGGAADFFFADVADEGAVRSMIDAVVQRFGSLHIAVNNAGVEGKTVPLCDLPSDNWRTVLDVDLSSVFYCMKAEIEQMVRIDGGGAIVNTASASGLIGGYNLSAYTAAKHGVVGLTKAAAADYGSKGIRINALCPGPIDTPFIDELPEAFRNRLMFGVPLNRLGQAEEMANAILWLCSDAASYVTGHALSVDGGVVASSPSTRMEDLV